MKLLRDNGLTIVLILATIASLVGMLLTGLSVYNEDLALHSMAPVSLSRYVTSGHFLSALFENWESEFLQMCAYVALTAFLFQRGSAESKDPDAAEETDSIVERNKEGMAVPLLGGGLFRAIYSYSLGLALFILFMASFVLHLRNSMAAAGAEAGLHGQPAPLASEYMWSANLWFESFQNWQSEFLSTAVLVVLSIFLRFRGSPESKPVAAPHSQTGS